MVIIVDFSPHHFMILLVNNSEIFNYIVFFTGLKTILLRRAEPLTQAVRFMVKIAVVKLGTLIESQKTIVV